jgi:hypothetical protein
MALGNTASPSTRSCQSIAISVNRHVGLGGAILDAAGCDMLRSAAGADGPGPPLLRRQHRQRRTHAHQVRVVVAPRS